MTEQPQFGKRAVADLPAEYEDEETLVAELSPRHAFADEYEGFDQKNSGIDSEYAAEEPPPPVEGLWGSEAVSVEPEIRTYIPPSQRVEEIVPPAEEMWGGASAPQPYQPPVEDASVEIEEVPAESAEEEYAWSAPEPESVEVQPEETTNEWHALAPDFNETPDDSWRPSEIVVKPWSESGGEPQSGHTDFVPAEEAPSFGPKLSVSDVPPMEWSSPSLSPQASPSFQNEQDSEEALSLQDELLAIVQQHQEWVDSGGREGRRATFRGEYFRGADFSGLMLAEASFRSANLSATKFRGANLERADFVESNLSAADFTHASLSRATFQRAQLAQTDFSMVSAQETDFSAVDAVGAIFQRAQLEWAIFRDAQLGGADFKQANLSKSNLRGATVFRAKMEDANLTQADCREANFDSATMTRALLLQTNFRSANLQGVDLQTADFTQALDVAMEVQVDSAHKSKELLQEEARRLEILKTELLAKERELDQEREKLRNSPAAARASYDEPLIPRARLNSFAEQSEMSAFLKSNGKLFMKIGAVWLVMVLISVGILLSVLSEMDSSELNFLELVILGVLLLVPLALSVVGVVKSMNISKRLLESSAEQES
jgi:uncharacterized protein YjbI with pentapeptide repeats